MNRLRLKKLLWILGGIVLAVLLLLLCQALLLPLGLAAALCYILLPLVKHLERYNLPGWLAITLVYAGLFSLLAVASVWGVPRLWRDVAAIGQLLPETIASCQSFWQNCHDSWPERLGLPMLPSFMDDCLRDFINGLGDSLYNWLMRSLRLLPSFFSNISTLIFAPVFAFYFMRDRQTFVKLARQWLSPEWERRLLPLCTWLSVGSRLCWSAFLPVALALRRAIQLHPRPDYGRCRTYPISGAPAGFSALPVAGHGAGTAGHYQNANHLVGCATAGKYCHIAAHYVWRRASAPPLYHLCRFGRRLLVRRAWHDYRRTAGGISGAAGRLVLALVARLSLPNHSLDILKPWHFLKPWQPQATKCFKPSVTNCILYRSAL